MAINPALYAFSAEFLGDHPAHSDFEKYLRMEFVKRHPGWEPSFGRATWFDRDVKAYDYMFLLRGHVPEATSQSDAEGKVHKLLDEIAEGLKSLRPKTATLPKPIIRVWRHSQPEKG